MLTTLDFQKIACEGYMVDHCHGLMSLVLGEPYLEEGILYYFDGKMVTINGYSLGLEPEAAAETIRLIADKWRKHPSLEAVTCFGPVVPDLQEVLGTEFELLDRAEPDPFVVDMKVDLNQPLGKVARRDARRARERGIDVQLKKVSLLTHEHLEILGDFMRTHEVDPLSRSVISNLNAYLRDPETFVVEALHEGRRLGFATLSLALLERPLLTLAFYRHNVPYASDAVMNFVREHCQEKGHASLGVGMSGSESSYRYKIKWGASPSSPPFASVFHLRKNSEFPSDVIGWGARLLQHGNV